MAWSNAHPGDRPHGCAFLRLDHRARSPQRPTKPRPGSGSGWSTQPPGVCPRQRSTHRGHPPPTADEPRHGTGHTTLCPATRPTGRHHSTPDHHRFGRRHLDRATHRGPFNRGFDANPHRAARQQQRHTIFPPRRPLSRLRPHTPSRPIATQEFPAGGTLILGAVLRSVVDLPMSGGYNASVAWPWICGSHFLSPPCHPVTPFRCGFMGNLETKRS